VSEAPAVARAGETHHSPGSVVVIRDETWVVQRTERTRGGWFVYVQGLSELVRGTEAVFSDRIDEIERLDPARAQVRVDDSPHYAMSRLWLEAIARKTAVPIREPRLTVARSGLVDVLPYQLSAVEKALGNLRTRILLADAVGLGKTIEIGMILAELVRRGRGERILIVTPRHVLEQMQFELWTRFALPFVRLDSLGIQRIRQQLPASRNPFAYFRRVIVSIDTLKSDRYHAHLAKQHWDAVVIDESHNVTNDATQNNRLARLLSSRTDALILASATPHNGKKESFAELIRMLEPSAVTPEGELVADEVARLVVRRHRYSPEVATAVGGDWAERLEPNNVLVPANAAENEIARELERSWLFTEAPERAGSRGSLVPWTLAKAFLSSPAALRASILARRRIARDGEELAALDRLLALCEQSLAVGSAKLDALFAELARIGIRRSAPARVVIFAERVSTLTWLHEQIVERLRLKEEQVAVLHGGLSDVEQQVIVESFKQESSPIRVLVTGDVASEGVNLHLQCHELIHFDIPWSLIRIEQRNGRIDRYGQRHRPQITTLLLCPDAERFGGDVRVLRRLVEKEHEAHRALGDSASLMGRYDIRAEEAAIREVLAGRQQLDDVVRTVEEVRAGDDVAALLSELFDSPAAPNAAAEAKPTSSAAEPVGGTTETGLFADEAAFLTEAVEQVFETPARDARAGGISWREHPNLGLVEFEPTSDLRKRLEVLPQSYLRERRVQEKLMLATSRARGGTALDDARSRASTSLWPSAHYLAPLHPALEWAADRALGALGRNEVFAVAVPSGAQTPMQLLTQGVLSNARGQVVAVGYVVVRFLDSVPLPQPVDGLATALDLLGIDRELVNIGALGADARFDGVIAAGVDATRTVLRDQFAAASTGVDDAIARWIRQAESWQEAAEGLIQRQVLAERRRVVADDVGIARSMRPAHSSVRPLLLVVEAGAA